MTERKILIAIIGQSAFDTGYDEYIYVTDDDLEKRFTEGQKLLEELGQGQFLEINQLPMIEDGILSGPKITASCRIKECLVDNRIIPTVFEGIRHAFGIAGDEAVAREVRNLIDQRLPRHFSAAPGSQNTGKFDKEFDFSVEEGFDLFQFNTVEDVYNSLKELKNES